MLEKKLNFSVIDTPIVTTQMPSGYPLMWLRLHCWSNVCVSWKTSWLGLSDLRVAALEELTGESWESELVFSYLTNAVLWISHMLGHSLLPNDRLMKTGRLVLSDQQLTGRYWLGWNVRWSWGPQPFDLAHWSLVFWYIIIRRLSASYNDDILVSAVSYVYRFI